MERQNVVFTHMICESLERALHEINFDKLFVLMDETTQAKCYDKIRQCDALAQAGEIIIGATDTHKNVESLCHVWESLSRQGATRKSLLINLGGGMVTDMGGFAASTFKRGIKFINIPTTLLAMVDASVGGKTGINFNGLKNEIGVFNNAETVFIDSDFLSTLDTQNMLSGYAEMLKHGLISTAEHWARLVNFDVMHPDMAELQKLIQESVEVKQSIVLEDATEKGIRKALNFGHTLGHAFESLAMEQHRPILHGYAVAWGMIGELYLCHVRKNFPSDIMRQTIQFIKENYGIFQLDCKMYARIHELMTHDKKNADGIIRCTLLSSIGNIALDEELTQTDINEMLDFVRES